MYYYINMWALNRVKHVKRSSKCAFQNLSEEILACRPKSKSESNFFCDPKSLTLVYIFRRNSEPRLTNGEKTREKGKTYRKSEWNRFEIRFEEVNWYALIFCLKSLVASFLTSTFLGTFSRENQSVLNFYKSNEGAKRTRRQIFCLVHIQRYVS